MEIKNLREINEPYVKCRFSLVLSRADLDKMDSLEVNFCSLKESKGRQWVNLLSLKEREGPAEGEYVPLVRLNGLDLGTIKEKVKEALQGLKNKPGGDSTIYDGIPF